MLRVNRCTVAILAGALLASPALAGERPTGASGGKAWADVVAFVFGGAPMHESGFVTIEAPSRAEDAAIVPMTMRVDLPADDPRSVTELTLVIDENPAPVAATFEVGPDAGLTQISTRVRVQSYTPVHAVARLSDGSLHVAETFVKASGGCAAPMAKDPEEARHNIGMMRLRQFQPADAEAGFEAQLMIRHPNNSGLQMDQLTRFYIPAHFLQDLVVRQGDALVMGMEGGISLSEDPNFRLAFRPTGAPISVEAVDTDGPGVSGEWPVEAPRS
jgi:sulfur-oxidizing protein SoxY